MGVTEDLARHIVETGYDGLPLEVVQTAKDVILDGMGVMLAGSREEPPRIVAEYAQELGGAPRCTAFGFGFRTSPTLAAFINGVSAHVLDYEPMWYPPTHALSPTLPPILALAEARGLCGRDVITALAVGFEAQGRLLLAADASNQGWELSFHPPGVVGPLGAAAAAAKLLGLDVQRTRWALGIAASRAGSLFANIGTMTKASHCGNAGRLGLEAALLAAKGFTANEEVIEAPSGWARAFYPQGLDAAAVRAFGRPWRMVEPGLAIKKYPSQYGTHRGIDAALELRERHGVEPAAIARVVVTAPVMEYVNRPSPRTGLEGKFSFQYTVAAALLDGKVTVHTFRDARLFSSDMKGLLPRVELRMDPTIPSDLDGMWVEVEATTAEGRSVRARCERPRGIWDNPLTREERLEKFRQTAGMVLDPSRVARAAEVIQGLETAPNVTEFLAVMSSPGQG